MELDSANARYDQITELGVQYLQPLEEVRIFADARAQEKSCVFCGNKPKGKNREDVIPLWLTDPSRELNRGCDFPRIHTLDGEISVKELKVPSCESCNTRYSALETTASGVMRSIGDNQQVSEDDCLDLLDWFDKVRYGYALAATRRLNNPLGTIQSFHIKNRIAQEDRALLIHKGPQHSRGIVVSPPDPLFLLHPTHISIRIDDLLFTSVSELALCTETLGIAEVEIGAPIYPELPNLVCSYKGLDHPPDPAKFPIDAKHAVVILQSIGENSTIDFGSGKTKKPTHRTRTGCFLLEGNKIYRFPSTGSKLPLLRLPLTLVQQEHSKMEKQLDIIALRNLRAYDSEWKKVHDQVKKLYMHIHNLKSIH